MWPYDSRQKCTVKEVLKLCGQYIRVLSFPNGRVPSTLVEMLQYCSNVQHLSLPSTKLDPEQVRKITHHMMCLQTLQLKVGDNVRDIKQLLIITGQLGELAISSTFYSYTEVNIVFKHWVELKLMPSSFNVIITTNFSNIIKAGLVDYVTQLTTIPTGTAAVFRIYDTCDKVPLSFSPTLPSFLLQFEATGQVTIPCVRFGMGLKNDVAVMTNCQDGGRTMCMVRYLTKSDDIVIQLDSTYCQM